jgi:hypothetical protein
LYTTGVAKEQKENSQVDDNQPSYFDFEQQRNLLIMEAEGMMTWEPNK